jgi:hypothetical protein
VEQKKPKREVEQEAKLQATEMWSQPMRRDKIKTAVDHHMDRMFTEMFGKFCGLM